MDIQSGKSHVLTPVLSSSRIPILVLIRLYCYQKLPQRCIPPILSKLVELITNPNADAATDNSNNNSNNKKDLLDVYFPSLLSILDSIGLAISSFFSSSQVDSSLVQDDIKLVKHLILKELWNLHCYEDFFTFIESLSLLIVDSNTEFDSSLFRLEMHHKPSKLLLSSSFLGSVIVSMGSSVSSLNFEDGLKVWKAFMGYRQESEKIWILMDGIGNRVSDKRSAYFETFILPQSYVVEDNAKVDLYSIVDLSCLFQSQVSELQKKSSVISKPLKELLGSLSQSERSLIPSSYHVEYLDNWRSANYDASFDALHRYFDYMMSNKRQYFYHYALLALASMHSSFGSNEEALRAINEAILVARENKDLDCLNYLLTWLLNFTLSRPELFMDPTDHPSRTEIINFLRSKTKETKNNLLQAITFQFEALVAILEGSDLSVVMEHITKSLFLILNLENCEDTKTRFVNICQLCYVVWARIGYVNVANIYLESAIEIARETDHQFDLSVLYIRKATMIYSMGQVSEAFEILSNIEDLVSEDFNMNKKWKTAHNIISFYVALKRCDYDECVIIISGSEALSKTFDDQEVTNEIIYQKALLQFNMNNIDVGFEIVTDRLSLMKANPIVYNHYWFIKFQILYASAFVEFTKYPERGLSVLLNAINLTHKSSSIYGLCESILCLCKLILKSDPSGSIADVKSLLTEIFSKIIQTKNLDMISTAYYLTAYVGYYEAANQEGPSTEFLRHSDVILNNLNIAISGYTKMCDNKNLKITLELQRDIAINMSLPKIHQEAIFKLDELEQAVSGKKS